MVKNARNLFVATAAMAIAASGISPVYAQDAQPEEMAEDSGGLNVIIVTARKKDENLQETPVSIMALSGDSLDQQNVADLKGLDIKFPNIAVGGSGGLGGSNAAFFVRGIGTARNAVNQETTTALYVDDEYYGRTDGAILSVLDVERIEVLRGPQGTLFGRGAVAGAIRYITKKPTDVFEGNFQATLGSHSRRDFKGVINVPLGDTAAFRLTGASLHQNGHVNGLLSGIDYGDNKAELIRGQFKWDASDTFDILLSADYTHTDTNGGAAIPVQVFPAAPFFSAEAAAVGGPFASANPPIGDFRNSYQTGNNFYNSENFGAALTMNWEISSDIDFKSATSYRNIDIAGAYDGDGTNLDIFEQDFVRDIETFSQEFQLSGSTGSLEWIAGLYYYSEKASDIREVGLTSNAGPNRTGTRIINPYKVDSYAIFGQGTYELSNSLSVTAGLRWTKDKKSIQANELRANGVSRLVGLADPNNPSQILTPPEFVSNGGSFSAPSWRASLEYKAADDVFLFASYARGYRSGGFNDRIRTDTGVANFYGVTQFEEETLDMFEVGIRSELFDNRLRLNLTGFYGRYHDMQIAAAIPNSAPLRTVVQNIGEGEVSGIEGEFVFKPNDFLTLDGSIGILDAKYVSLDPNALVAAVTLNSDFGRAPKFSFALGGQIDYEGFSARVDYAHKSDQRLLVPDSAAIIQEAYGLLSASISYGPEDGFWKVTLFGTNLTDEEYAVSGLRVANPLGFAAVEPGRFREWGVKLGFTF